MKIDFENIEQRCIDAINSDEYVALASKINKAKKVFLLGNGGLHFVASHMATDLSRLIPDKAVYSFDSVGFITSNANDHGFEMLFLRWLETMAKIENPDDCLVIGLSCSGNSSNVINAVHWADDNGMDTFMVSGQKSEILKTEISELSFECDYFHTVEVMCMILFYDLIHQTDNKCPSIRGEKNRLKDSSLRSLD
jgi:D-sedoheptulose 7-phosphate isomerase|tara:strand:- start:295 stop:879 length:585 start_codon:yes stop_codon:yes gene_type:complete